ncbi:probable 2-oxoglutarate-dependent dioxygenase AOP1 [Ziziphus jujuba]|uniref:Probable 2-oxoglutarate-dependent dioxygenase AOP1 n=1 Tax=Ziziphus jujuba TaxID=326968 RepID=A0A6P3Z1K8_ZIZJJ|nr:probable 2-oxoglutarate-dependent dioxygenase AOP1 [Ziziphus jujuba]
MGSQTEMKVPVIDLTKENLKPGTDSWISACKQVRYAFEEYGCVEVVYDKVSMELGSSMFAVVDDLFNLPIETKMQNTSDRPYHSYFGRYSFIPLYESLGIDNPTTLEGAQHFTNIMWPQGNDHFRETVQTYSKLVAEINGTVTRMLFDSYGVERLCESHMEWNSYLLRCFRYRTRRPDEPDLGLWSHTDRTFISTLHQNQISGLQIKTKDGQWIDVEPSGSSFLVLAGDVLMAWSNDRIPSCDHRVIMKENKIRYSLGLFSFNNGLIKVPEELVDDQFPLRYKPFNNFDYLRFTQAEESKKYGCAIKAYCGV